MRTMIDKPFLHDEPAPLERLFTREQFHWLMDNRILREERHYELIKGVIVEKMSQKEPHIGLLLLWFYALGDALGREFLRSQAPIALSNLSEPEPDIAVTTRPFQHYLRSGTIPTANEVRLVIEISVTTLTTDMSTKADSYAQSGIPEYVILDATGHRLIVHRDPTPDGYASVVSLTESDVFSPLAAPGASFAVVDFLP